MRRWQHLSAGGLGGLLSLAIHGLDAVVDAIALTPVAVLSIGAALSVVMLSAMPDPSMSLRDEVTSFRAWLVGHVAVVAAEQPPVPGAEYLGRALLRLLDDFLAGVKIAPGDVAPFIDQFRSMEPLREARGHDPYKAQRAWAVDLLGRLCAELSGPEVLTELNAKARPNRGQRIKAALEAKGWTHERLAALAGVDRTAVTHWVSGSRGLTRAHQIKLEGLLKMRPGELDDD